MDYYFDKTFPNITLENAKIILRTNNNFFDCERFNIIENEWVEDQGYSKLVMFGQVEYEEITRMQAMQKIQTMKKVEYKKICDKLGFIPTDYKRPRSNTEDDSLQNPYSVLTLEELHFVYKNIFKKEIQ